MRRLARRRAGIEAQSRTSSKDQAVSPSYFQQLEAKLTILDKVYEVIFTNEEMNTVKQQLPPGDSTRNLLLATITSLRRENLKLKRALRKSNKIVTGLRRFKKEVETSEDGSWKVVETQPQPQRTCTSGHCFQLEDKLAALDETILRLRKQMFTEKIVAATTAMSSNNIVDNTDKDKEERTPVPSKESVTVKQEIVSENEEEDERLETTEQNPRKRRRSEELGGNDDARRPCRSGGVIGSGVNRASTSADSIKLEISGAVSVPVLPGKSTSGTGEKPVVVPGNVTPGDTRRPEAGSSFAAEVCERPTDFTLEPSVSFAGGVAIVTYRKPENVPRRHSKKKRTRVTALDSRDEKIESIPLHMLTPKDRKTMETMIIVYRKCNEQPIPTPTEDKRCIVSALTRGQFKLIRKELTEKLDQYKFTPKQMEQWPELVEFLKSQTYSFPENFRHLPQFALE